VIREIQFGIVPIDPLPGGVHDSKRQILITHRIIKGQMHLLWRLTDNAIFWRICLHQDGMGLSTQGEQPEPEAKKEPFEVI